MTNTPNSDRDDSSGSERFVRELRRPQAYSHSVDEVGFRRTHISLLFFAGERVYKVKQPVDLGFLDFTTLERRRHFCEEEVRLNRRLAPDVYLGVVPITRAQDGHLRVGATACSSAEPVEWAVEMVRLPESRMLDSLFERGEIDNECMNSIAALLADFHARAATGPDVDEHGSPSAITANLEENFEQLREFVGDPSADPSTGLAVLTPGQHDFLQRRARHHLAHLHGLLERRVEAGRIRDGHGDLHASNICFPSTGVVAYDCIEFSRRFRCGDVAADLAFLAMDLDNRGFPAFSQYLMKRYAELADDPELRQLGTFYKGYRALVRAKVAALTALAPAAGAVERGALRAEAARYVQLAAGYELPPALVLMCGLPACGKSWLARHLARPLRASLLRSDVRRKALAGKPPTQRVHGEYGAGLYAPEKKAQTYRSLLASALRLLRSGHSVIVDATLSQREYRAPFIDAAARLELPYFIVHVSAPEALTRQRLAEREQDADEASDADLEVYLRARASFEAPTEVPRGHVVEVASGRGRPEDASSELIERMIALQGSAARGEGARGT